ncbi:hypothetical protein QJS10_CPA09g01081 [Acorus calamus]|uniref:Uncharacterized protein n=1 Tax=Acorus calamus TaxID=4465 RepID=A0AAV9E459_ACOCL|nr:hypothetical protein QJS10_CPA09g01081 [Acorus calamus]
MAVRSVGEGGSSFVNFNEFIESMKKVVVLAKEYTQGLKLEVFTTIQPHLSH